MEEFLQDLGFRIAGAPLPAIAIGVATGLAGLLVAYLALRDDEALPEYRTLSVLLGVGLAVGIAIGMPFVHRVADHTCDRWAASAEPSDELQFLRERCAERF